MFKLVVLSCLAVVASAGIIAPLGAIAYGAPWLTPYNYRGPLSLAPGQPANILGADGRPLDTLDVNLDRSAHYAAKGFDGAGLHLLKKRSVLATPLGYSPYNNIGLPISPYVAASPLITPTSSLAFSAPLSPLAYGASYAHVY